MLLLGFKGNILFVKDSQHDKTIFTFSILVF